MSKINARMIKSGPARLKKLANGMQRMMASRTGDSKRRYNLIC